MQKLVMQFLVWLIVLWICNLKYVMEIDFIELKF